MKENVKEELLSSFTFHKQYTNMYFQESPYQSEINNKKLDIYKPKGLFTFIMHFLINVFTASTELMSDVYLNIYSILTILLLSINYLYPVFLLPIFQAAQSRQAGSPLKMFNQAKVPNVFGNNLSDKKVNTQENSL